MFSFNRNVLRGLCSCRKCQLPRREYCFLSVTQTFVHLPTFHWPFETLPTLYIIPGVNRKRQKRKTCSRKQCLVWALFGAAALIIWGLFNLWEATWDLTKQSARLCLFTAHLCLCVCERVFTSASYQHNLHAHTLTHSLPPFNSLSDSN